MSNPTKKTNSITKKAALKHWTDEFPDLKFLRTKPTPLALLERLGKQFENEVRADKEMITPEEFFAIRGIHHNMIEDYRRESEDFDHSYISAMEIIGMRREKAGVTRLFDSGFVKSSMSQYSARWRKDRQEEAALKKPQEETEIHYVWEKRVLPPEKEE